MSSDRLCVGIPKETKPDEYRVAGLPEHVRWLQELGASVVVQSGAGEGSGFADARYAEAGAELVPDLATVHERADLLWKVKEPLADEYDLLRAEHTVFTYLHATSRPELTRAMLRAGCTGVAYEEIADEAGCRPLLVPMSRIAGAGAIAVATQFLQSRHGGTGKLMFRTEGVEPATVLVLGGGTSGRTATRAALGAGAKVVLLEVQESLVPELRRDFPSAVVLHSSDQTIRQFLPRADAVLNCTYWVPGDPHLLTRDMLSLMQPGSLIVDVAADPHGAIETSEETTHSDPIRVVDGVLHYCVQNIPSLFARSASEALTQATWPYLERMVRDGVERSLAECPELLRGVQFWRGEGVGEELAEAQGIRTRTHAELLAGLVS